VDSIESTLNWLSGNIQSDPCFASFDANGDPNLWDFHLLSKDGRWVIAFATVDITQDGFVDFQDFTVLAEVWLQEGEGLAGDLDDNGVVDLFDLQILSDSYLTAQQLQGTWVQDNTSSPCINAGDPESDWSAEPRPNGKRINMGAFGGTNQASKKGLKTDFDADGNIDFNDFSYLAANWGLEQTCIEDLDGNGIVDIEDLGEFCAGWLTQE
jgi:Ca2+-binding EF-hand superfamily protein